MRVGSSTVARARSGARGGWRGFVFVFAWDRSVRVLTCLEHLQHAAWKLALHAPHLARVRASLRFDTPPRDTSGGCGFEPRCRSFQIFGTALTELNCLASRCESFSSLSAHPRWRGAVAAGGDARCEANLLLGRSVDMGLFGDLPSAKDGSSRGDGGRSSETPTGGRSDGVAATTTPGSTAGKTGGWSGAGSALRAPPRKSPALLNPQMLKAQAAALRAQQAKLARQKEATSTDGPGGSSAARTPGTRPSASATPVVVRKTGIGGGDVPEPSAATYGTLSAEVDDEYTPGQPNSYEDVVRLRTRRAATEAAARERERQRVELERQRHELEEERRAAAAAAGTAPDRSSLNVTGEEAHTRRATLTFVKPGSRLHAQGAAVLAGEAEMKPEMKLEPQKPAAPVKDKDDPVLNIVYGVNHGDYDAGKDKIVTAASCTTNCLAPVVSVVQTALGGIKRGSITTIHNVTNTQTIVDAPNSKKSDLRRARSGMTNLAPTSTGSATAIALIFPELKGKLNGLAVRVPLLNGSLTDCVFELNEETSAEKVNAAMKAASESGDLRGILGYEEQPLVSTDYINDTRSGIVDALSTMVVDKTHLKMYIWYDNEYGYSARMVDIARMMVAKGL